MNSYRYSREGPEVVNAPDGIEVYHPQDGNFYHNKHGYTPANLNASGILAAEHHGQFPTVEGDTYKESYQRFSFFGGDHQSLRNRTKTAELAANPSSVSRAKKKIWWLWPLLAVLAVLIIAGGVTGGLLGRKHPSNQSVQNLTTTAASGESTSMVSPCPTPVAPTAYSTSGAVTTTATVTVVSSVTSSLLESITAMPTSTSVISTGTCTWTGHCLGDPCSDFNDCASNWVCPSGVCVVCTANCGTG